MCNQSPLVSIIMSVFNEDDNYLRQCIESIISQSYQNIEFIIISDNTSKSNIETILSYKSTNIVLIKNKINLGLTKSLNIGARNARGKYFARIDSDDFSDSKRIEKQVSFMEENTAYSLCGTKAYEIKNNKKQVQHTKFYSNDNELQKAKFKFNPFTHSSLMFKASDFKEIGGYDEDYTYSQDYMLIFQLSLRGKIHNLTTPLTTRRMDNNRISSEKQIEQTLFSIQIRKIFLKHATISTYFSCLYSITKSYIKILFLRKFKSKYSF